MNKRILLIISTFILVVSGSLYATMGGDPSFQDWVQTRSDKLKGKSKIANTPYGPIEYIKDGFGPVVLCLHGAPGGYDQAYLIGKKLIHRGFTVLAVSRPGYLRTPLSVGITPEQQADALVGLLDALNIPKVAVLGFSAGGHVAYQFALRHPDRAWAMVLKSVGGEPSNSPLYTLVGDLVKDAEPDLSAWLVYLSAEHNISATAKWILPLDNNLGKEKKKKRINHVLKNKKQIELLHDLVLSALPISLRFQGLQNDLAMGNRWPSLPHASISTPTLLIQSKDDKSGGFQDALKASHEIPGAQLVTVDQTGHFIWLGKNSSKFESKLIKFLKIHQPKTKK